MFAMNAPSASAKVALERPQVANEKRDLWPSRMSTPVPRLLASPSVIQRSLKVIV